MFAVAWKETLSNGSQPIRMKQFRTEDARADFIDTLRDNGVSFQITSMNSAGDPELQDFRKGMRVTTGHTASRALTPTHQNRRSHQGAQPGAGGHVL